MPRKAIGKKRIPGRSASHPLRSLARKLRKAARQAKTDKAKKHKKKEDKQRYLEKQSFDLFQREDRILILDDANFSFGLSVAAKMRAGQGLLATAVETKAELKAKHPEAFANRKEIEEEWGGTTLVGITPTRLHKVEQFREAFDTIVWLFPHIDTDEEDLEKIAEMHQKLFYKFFKSASQCLDPERKAEAAIYVTLTQGEPFKSWKLVQCAKRANPTMGLKSATIFNPNYFPGYVRCSLFDPEEPERVANLYIFNPGTRVLLEGYDDDDE